MSISIRRCLSMLRNTSDGNELAVPAINALEGAYCRRRYTVYAGSVCWVLDTAGCCTARCHCHRIVSDQQRDGTIEHRDDNERQASCTP